MHRKRSGSGSGAPCMENSNHINQMRIRTIKPEFFLHEGLYQAETEEQLPLRVAFAGLWCASDRNGRFKWEPRRLGIQILPYDNVDFSRVLDALTTRGFLVKYASGTGVFGHIPGFLRHQVVNNKEKASDIPEPTAENIEIIGISNDIQRVPDACLTREPRVDDACHKEGKGKEQGKEQEESPWVIAFGVELPESLRTENCLEAVKLWLKYKSERREGYKQTGLKAALTKWSREFTAATFPSAVDHSMASGWSGIFPPKESYQAQPQRHAPDTSKYTPEQIALMEAMG